MAKYVVQDSLRHNGKDVEIGESIEMSEAEAAPLVVSGVLIDQATTKAKAKAQAEAEAAQVAAEKAAAEAAAASGQ